VSVISKKEREMLAREDRSFTKENSLALCCHQGVWDEGAQGFEESQMYQTIINIDRKNDCFFWPYQPGMRLPVAKELERREADRNKANREQHLTRIGLWIAAIAFFLQLVVNIIELCRGKNN
jgi:hypothetical protein